MRFLFFKKSRLAPRPNPTSANHLAAAIYCFCSCFFPNQKVGTPTHAWCIGKQRGTGGRDVARPCRHMLVETKGFSSRWKWNFRKQASGSVPTANGGGQRMLLYEMLIAIGIAVVLVVAAIDRLATRVMMGPEEMALLRLARAAAAQQRLVASAVQQQREAAMSASIR